MLELMRDVFERVEAKRNLDSTDHDTIVGDSYSGQGQRARSRPARPERRNRTPLRQRSTLLAE